MKMRGLLRKDINMENPTKQGNYTTIFRDGSVILENPWLIMQSGKGKWYWDEECRGGVIAWNEIPEGGYKPHKWYKLPEEELRELVLASLTLGALEDAGVDNWKYYDQAIKDYCSHYYAKSIKELADSEINCGYYSGYVMT